MLCPIGHRVDGGPCDVQLSELQNRKPVSLGFHSNLNENTVIIVNLISSQKPRCAVNG